MKETRESIRSKLEEQINELCKEVEDKYKGVNVFIKQEFEGGSKFKVWFAIDMLQADDIFTTDDV